MKQYLFSVYHPDVTGARRRRPTSSRSLRDVGAVNDELRAAGAWVFAGGLHPSSTATVLERPTARCWSPTARSRGQGAHRRDLGDQGPRPRCRAQLGPQGRARVPDPRRGAPLPGGGAGLTAPPESNDVARVFREEYGRAVAVLVRVFGDIGIAEDAVQEAFALALRALAADGPAPQPRRLDHHHRAQPRDRPTATRVLARRSATRRPRWLLAQRGGKPRSRRARCSDDRLRLMFTCCHPALAPAPRRSR